MNEYKESLKNMARLLIPLRGKCRAKALKTLKPLNVLIKHELIKAQNPPWHSISSLQNKEFINNTQRERRKGYEYKELHKCIQTKLELN